MKKMFSGFFLLFFLGFVFSLSVLEVNLQFSEDDISITNVKLIEADNFSVSENNGFFSLVLVDDEGLEINRINFFASCILGTSIRINSDASSSTETVYCSKDLFVLYSPDANKLVLQKEGIVIQQFDLAFLCNNNGVCENNETTFSCKSDCPINVNDGVCDPISDGVCDPDCSKTSDPDCVITSEKPAVVQKKPIFDFNDSAQKEVENQNPVMFFIPFIIIFGLLLVGLFIYMVKKKS